MVAQKAEFKAISDPYSHQNSLKWSYRHLVTGIAMSSDQTLKPKPINHQASTCAPGAIGLFPCNPFLNPRTRVSRFGLLPTALDWAGGPKHAKFRNVEVTKSCLQPNVCLGTPNLWCTVRARCSLPSELFPGNSNTSHRPATHAPRNAQSWQVEWTEMSVTLLYCILAQPNL